MTEYGHSAPTRLAAKYLGVCEASLRAWRAAGTGPRYYRAGEKLIRYRIADLDEWIESRLSEKESPVIEVEDAPDPTTRARYDCRPEYDQSSQATMQMRHSTSPGRHASSDSDRSRVRDGA
jgi:hypothetical protein